MKNAILNDFIICTLGGKFTSVSQLTTQIVISKYKLDEIFQKMNLKGLLIMYIFFFRNEMVAISKIVKNTKELFQEQPILLELRQYFCIKSKSIIPLLFDEPFNCFIKLVYETLYALYMYRIKYIQLRIDLLELTNFKRQINLEIKYQGLILVWSDVIF